MTDDGIREKAEIIKRLPKGAARALLSMTNEWKFCGRKTFNANGAHSLFWACGGYQPRNVYVETEPQKDGKWSRTAYRLTFAGLRLRSLLKEASDA